MNRTANHPPEPTAEQCEQHATVEHNGHKFTACWYPQMGGYGSMCWVCKDMGDGECFEVWVWHDGEFPFSEDRDGYTGPNHLHHCSAEQFIDFGQFVDGLPGLPKEPEPDVKIKGTAAPFVLEQGLGSAPTILLRLCRDLLEIIPAERAEMRAAIECVRDSEAFLSLPELEAERWRAIAAAMRSVTMDTLWERAAIYQFNRASAELTKAGAI